MATNKNGNLLVGLVLIALGVVFLLNTMGLFPWRVWSQLWRLWPLILVLIGLKKIVEN